MRTRTILKANPKRTVSLERWEGPEGERGHVIKRFHSPGLLDRFSDRSRAAREFDLLRALSARGLPVPAAVEVRRSDGRWELVTDWIPGTVALADVLAGRAPWPIPPERAARLLGRELAHTHAAGLEHHDLHAGNILLSPDGDVWLVDVHRSRIVDRLPTAAARGDLVRLVAGTRERLSFRFRARCLASYLRALPPALRTALPAAGDLAREVETRARGDRRDLVRRRSRRWARTSSACRPWSSDGHRGLARADLDPEAAVQLCARIAEHAPAGDEGFRFALDDGTGRHVIGRSGSSWSALRDAWFRAGRLEDHRVPAARPLCTMRGSTSSAGRRRGPWMAFTVPGDARRLDRVLPTLTPRERSSCASALGGLIGTLHDRGLDVVAEPESSLGYVWLDGEGALRFDFETPLGELAHGSRTQSLRWVAPLGHADRPEGHPAEDRAAFARAYAAAHRHSAEERRTILEELRDG